MCWNTTASSLTLGIGFFSVLTGIYIINDKWFTYYSLTFLYLLLMQLAELIAYISKKYTNQRAPFSMRYATQLALLANVTQPLYAGLVLIAAAFSTPEKTPNRYLMYLCLAVLTAYSIWLCVMASTTMDKYVAISKGSKWDPKSEPCYSTTFFNPGYKIFGHDGLCAYYGKRLEYKISKGLEFFFGAKQEDCHSHVIYPWWRQINPAFYIVALASAIVLLIRPFSFMIYTAASIFGILILSCIFFNDGEVGSQWCFFTVILTILNPIFYWLLVKRKQSLL